MVESSSGGGIVRFEVISRDLIQEFSELLDLVLLLVGHGDARGFQNGLVCINRGPSTQGQRNGIGGMFNQGAEVILALSCFLLCKLAIRDR